MYSTVQYSAPVQCAVPGPLSSVAMGEFFRDAVIIFDDLSKQGVVYRYSTVPVLYCTVPVLYCIILYCGLQTDVLLLRRPPGDVFTSLQAARTCSQDI